MNLTSLSPQQLRQAADLKEEIEGLEEQLNSILSGEVTPPVTVTPPAASEAAKKGKRTFSAESRAKMAAAQKARWAAKQGVVAAAESGQPLEKPKKRTISETHRKALALAAKAR